MNAREMIKAYQLELLSGDRIRFPAKFKAHADELKAMKPEILKAFAEIAHEKRYPSTIDYKVYDDTGYGIYNGFWHYDDAISGIVEDAGFTGSLSDIVGDYNYKISIRCYDFVPLDNLMQYYVPNEIDDCWNEDYKNAIRKQIAERRALGHCHVPYDVAQNVILTSLCKCVVEKMPEIINQAEKELEWLSKIKIYDTHEAARASEKLWNDINNDGGEGYVPHSYTRYEVEYKQKRLEEMNKNLEIARKYLESCNKGA